MIKPIRPFLILLYVFILLGILMFFIPKGEQSIGEDISFTFFDYKDVFLPQQNEKKDIDSVLALFEQLEALEEEVVMDTLTKVDSSQTDTLVKKDTVIPVKKVKIADVLNAKYRIQFPDKSYDALANFFTALRQTNDSTEILRIVHYGDSQLEGDRITSDLRKKFQSRFGGCGIGISPITESVHARSTIRQEYSEGWHKYLIYGNHYDKALKHNYGVLGSYFGFDAVGDTSYAKSAELSKTDTLEQVAMELDTIVDKDSTWVKFITPYRIYRKNFRFEKTTLLYGDAPTAFNWTFTDPDTSINHVIPKATGFNTYEVDYSADNTFQELTFSFYGDKSPQLYGVSFDCNGGVAVDNVGMRGSAGVEFLRMDKAFLAKQMKVLNTKLIIVQFGVNVVPGELENYKWYEHRFYKQLRMLKSLHPEMNVLVVGVSDMAKKIEEQMASYPNVKLIRDAQRNAAMKAGCAFWDLYEAMGGENSMVAWVEAEKPLAGSDYTHFNPRGARMVASMLYNALMLEYQEYIK